LRPAQEIELPLASAQCEDQSKPTNQSLSMNDQISLIRQKCIAANPTDISKADNGRILRLADVLLAYSKEKFPEAEHIFTKEQGELLLKIYWDGVDDIIRRWDSRNDDLQGQPHESIELLYNLFK
jgi:hypothetical protein